MNKKKPKEAPKVSVVRLPEVPTDNQIEAALTHLPDMGKDRAKRALRAIYESFVAMRPENELPADMTKKMAQMMEAIQEYTDENDQSPTQMELADMFGVDRTTIRQRIHALMRRGYISKTSQHRGIRIIKRI